MFNTDNFSRRHRSNQGTKTRLIRLQRQEKTPPKNTITGSITTTPNEKAIRANR